jgi:uncharacterized membrane protein YhaH (DUF805 family)
LRASHLIESDKSGGTLTATMAAPPAIDPAKPEDALLVLKALAEVSSVFLVLTYVGGWSYLSAYYRTFGLNPLELDFKTPVISTLSIYVLYKSWWPLFVFALVVAVLALLVRRLRRLDRGWIAAALCVFLFVVVVAGANRGRSEADRDMVVQSSSLPNVTFVAKTNVGQLPCVEVGNFGSSDCKLLLHVNGAYYFFLPLPPAGRGILNLYSLPDAQVVASHVLRGLDRN